MIPHTQLYSTHKLILFDGFLETRYWATSMNALCSDKLNIAVTDIDECRLAFNALKANYAYPHNRIWSGTANDGFPRGCIIQVSGKHNVF